MRPVLRTVLSYRAATWLGRQSRILVADAKIDVKFRWRLRRRTMNANGIAESLRNMAGWRMRCMYCGDSEGCDIEHYRPKALAVFRPFVFDWRNFLWICQPCNRRKSAGFPLDAAGHPLLLDPAADRTWDYFDFVPATGYLVPRMDLDPVMCARAEATLCEQLTRLSHEVVLEERKRSARQLRRATEKFLSVPIDANTEKEFFNACIDAGYPELCEWFFAQGGSDDEPYADLIKVSPALVDRLKITMNSLFPGVWL